MSEERPEVAEDLEVNESGDGVVIFDAATDRVHHLNNTAALVLELCDGRRTAEEIATMVGAAFGLESSPLIETRQCLGRLADEGLVR